MNLYSAEPTEIVRSSLRDEEHLNEIESSLSSIIHFALRSQRRFVSPQWMSAIARTVYYAATTVSGVQTIGEEYLGLVQMQGSNLRFIASDFQRLFSSALESLHPLIITKLFNLLAIYGDKLRKQNHLHPGLYKLSQELPYLRYIFLLLTKNSTFIFTVHRLFHS
jgi:hypothetical protein